MLSKGKDLNYIFLTMKEVLVALKRSRLLLSGILQDYEQCASEVQGLNENWNTQLIKKGNTVRQTTKLSIREQRRRPLYSYGSRVWALRFLFSLFSFFFLFPLFFLPPLLDSSYKILLYLFVYGQGHSRQEP